jgi:hypothetical protein
VGQIHTPEHSGSEIDDKIDTPECSTTIHTARQCVTFTDVSSSDVYPVFNDEVCLSRPPLSVNYIKVINSSYSEVSSTYIAHSRSQCLYTNVDDNDDATSDPFENRYSVASWNTTMNSHVAAMVADA